MDLLSNYDDETSNTSNRSTTEQVQISNQKLRADGLLQSEWEDFEKMISPDSLLDKKDNSTKGDTQALDKELEASHLPEVAALKTNDEDEDESHLPPGVRKKNRCHSSSSSSSEDENGNESNSDSDISDSDDSETKNNTRSKIKEEKDSEGVKKDHKVEPENKTSDKRKKSKSVSKSRSRSPHSKRRRSSDRSRRSRSRSRSRHHRKERKRRSHRSGSRDRRRSKDRDHYRSRHKDHKHSRSRSSDRRERRRDTRSRGDSDRSRRSRSRDDSGRSRRSHSIESEHNQRRNRQNTSPRGGKVIKYGDKLIKAGASFGRPPTSKPMTFKEKMRQQLIKAIEEGGDAAAALLSNDGTVMCTQTAGIQQVPAPKKPPVPLMANIVTSTSGMNAATITASEAAMQSLIALQKETTEKTGVEIPKYYNPAAINPVKYAEQVQKRKLLWSKTKEKEVNSQWHATTLSSDHDDKSKEKFKKLMGIKQDGEDEEKISEELEQKQKELFEKLDKEYQYARMATHTHRGVGLGFGSSTYPPPSGT